MPKKSIRKNFEKNIFQGVFQFNFKTVPITRRDSYIKQMQYNLHNLITDRSVLVTPQMR
jgi:hypothetical protein